jgi:hypothetical protein
MAKPGSGKLIFQAINDLSALAYQVTLPSRSESYGRRDRILGTDGTSELALIHTRSHDEKDYRYVIGIAMRDLQRLDWVFVWLEKVRGSKGRLWARLTVN